jgi:hypothetical protein
VTPSPSGSTPFDAPELPVGDADELAGVVDLFGALSPPEVTAALAELAYRQRGAVDDDRLASLAAEAVAWAVERYYLVEYAPGDGVDAAAERAGADADDAETDPLVTVGPVAFPTLPDEAEDLPHILEFETRSVSRDSLARAVETRLRGDAARAVVAADEARIQHLFDVTYDLEAWASVDVREVRERLEDALAASDDAGP